MSISDFYVLHRTRKGNFLNRIEQLIDWKPIEQRILKHYKPGHDAGQSRYVIPSSLAR
jgi:hypothetical protein